jgi:hypothetical protein
LLCGILVGNILTGARNQRNIYGAINLTYHSLLYFIRQAIKFSFYHQFLPCYWIRWKNNSIGTEKIEEESKVGSISVLWESKYVYHKL